MSGSQGFLWGLVESKGPGSCPGGGVLGSEALGLWHPGGSLSGCALVATGMGALREKARDWLHLERKWGEQTKEESQQDGRRGCLGGQQGPAV